MRTYAIAYVVTAIAFLGIDAIWLSQAGPKLYRPLLGGLLTDNFQIVPAALFYVIYVAGIVIFAIAPALASDSWVTALVKGALLGFVAYAAYDLTNQSTLRDWPLVITIADLCWGTALSGVASTLGFLAARAAAGHS